MDINMFRFLIIFITTYSFTRANAQLFLTDPPNWVTSPYFRAGSGEVITSATSNTTTPMKSYTFTFSSPLSGVPNLAYGIKEYAGRDTFYNEGFLVNSVFLTASQFQVSVRIMPYTTVLRFSVAYIAIDTLFPHHLNSFDNIPVNYTSGVLTNISVTNSPTVRTFEQVYDYTAMATGRIYTAFTTPLTDQKILLFTSTIQMAGIGSNPVDWSVVWDIPDANHFSIKVTAQPYTYIGVLHFSMIIFNQKDIETNTNYRIIYLTWTTPQTGGFYSFPEQCMDSFIMGLVTFGADNRYCGIYYNWDFENTTSFGSRLDPSTVPSSGTISSCPLNSMTSNIFYLKNWYCDPPFYYFNLTSELCQTQCWGYSTQNSTDYTCLQCYYSCYSCNATTPQICLACDSTNDHRQLINDSCVCMAGSYENPIIQTPTCINCYDNITGCGLCVVDMNTTVVTCTECLVGYSFDVANNVCIDCLTQMHCINCSQTSVLCYQCDQSQEYFMNTTSNQCQICTPYCTDCLDINTCQQCDSTNDFRVLVNNVCECLPGYYSDYLNPTSSVCLVCTSGSPNCLYCSVDATNLSNIITTCSQCDPGYSLRDDLSCQPCSQFHCLSCSQTSTACFICNQTEEYFLNTTTNVCQICDVPYCIDCQSLGFCLNCNQTLNYGVNINTGQCDVCNLSCSCNGYYPGATPSDPCVGLCGDSKIRVDEQCDDGNTIDGDGCSSSCKIQNAWSCSNQPSCCSLLNQNDIAITKQSIVKDENSNKVTVTFLLTPSLPLVNNFNLTDSITSNLTSTYIDVSSFHTTFDTASQILATTFDFISSIQNLTVEFYLKFTVQSGICTSYPDDSQIITMVDDSNKPLIPFSEEQFKSKKNVQNVYLAIQILSYIALLASLVPAKIVGIQLFGVLQLAFFAVSDLDFVNLMLTPLMSMKHLNGLNLMIDRNPDSVPNRVQAVDYDANFLNNCNIMMGLVFTEIVAAVIIYLLSFLIIKVAYKLHIVAKHMLKQVLLTLILFNALNIAYSVGLHFTYADSSQNLYVPGTLLALVAIAIPFILVGCLLFTDAAQFGQYKNKFKPELINQSYFVVTIGYRIILGMYLASKNQSELSTLIAVAFSLFFIIYNFVNLPFKDTYMNYRANVCHLAQFVILFVTMYYRSMKSSTPIQSSAKIYAPAYFMLATIALALTVSIVCLIIEIYKFISYYVSGTESTRAGQGNSLLKLTENKSLETMNNNQDIQVLSPKLQGKQIQP